MNTSTTVNRQNQPQTRTELSRDEVAQRAYQLWEAAGRPAGQDLEHWLQAEEELLKASQPHRVNFEASDPHPVHAIAQAKERSTPTPAVSRKSGSKLNAASLEENGPRVAGARIR